MQPLAKAASLLSVALIVAGCAVPEEAREDEFGAVTIDGRVYDCEDKIDTDDVCDEYQYSANQDAMTTVTVSSMGGTVNILGREYVCEDVSQVDAAGGDEEPMAGECETYEMRGE